MSPLVPIAALLALLAVNVAIFAYAARTGAFAHRPHAPAPAGAGEESALPAATQVTPGDE